MSLVIVDALEGSSLDYSLEGICVCTLPPFVIILFLRSEEEVYKCGFLGVEALTYADKA